MPPPCQKLAFFQLFQSIFPFYHSSKSFQGENDMSDFNLYLFSRMTPDVSLWRCKEKKTIGCESECLCLNWFTPIYPLQFHPSPVTLAFVGCSVYVLDAHLAQSQFQGLLSTATGSNGIIYMDLIKCASSQEFGLVRTSCVYPRKYQFRVYCPNLPVKSLYLFLHQT